MEYGKNYIKVEVFVDKQGWLRVASTNERIRCLKMRERHSGRFPMTGHTAQMLLHPGWLTDLPKLAALLNQHESSVTAPSRGA
jgi:hypothetical protein